MPDGPATEPAVTRARRSLDEARWHLSGYAPWYARIRDYGLIPQVGILQGG